MKKKTYRIVLVDSKYWNQIIARVQVRQKFLWWHYWQTIDRMEGKRLPVIQEVMAATNYLRIPQDRIIDQTTEDGI